MSEPFLDLLQKPFVVMGVLNVTPDSFYDGGEHYSLERAVDHGKRLIDEGADVLDVGGESTRPGSDSVAVDEEIGRVVPVIEKLRAHSSVALSIDTSKSEVADKALKAGATWVNDVSAGRFDDRMAAVVARHQCPTVLMHSRETPKTMQHSPSYQNAVEEMIQELSSSIERFLSAGLEKSRIVVDPGIGFAKRQEDNLEILAHLDSLAALGYPVLIGTSRKSFIGRITGREVENRLWGTLATETHAFLRGAKIFRVHDVKETIDCLKVVHEIELHAPKGVPGIR